VGVVEDRDVNCQRSATKASGTGKPDANPWASARLSMVSVRKRHKVWPITGVSPSLVVGAAVADPYYYVAPPCGYYPCPPARPIRGI
jgi:hypothetical protein